MASSREYHALIHGDHVCHPATGPQRRIRMAVDFAQQGLWANDRVMFLTESPAPQELARLLVEAIPDAAAAIASRQILIESARDVYLRNGMGFDPAAVLDGLIGTVDAAIGDGHRGLRVDGDLTWLDGQCPNVAAISEYELAGNRCMLTMPIAGICHYDPEKFSAHDWAVIEAAHPEQLQDGNGLTGIRAVWSNPGSLTLAGTADLANATAFASLLDAVPPSSELTIDGSHLEFADARAMGCLLALSTRQPTLMRVPAPIAGYLNLLGAQAISDLRLEVC